MAEATKIPVKAEKAMVSSPERWEPLSGLRREIDRVFDSYAHGVLRFPFGRSAFDLELPWRPDAVALTPAVDVVEKEKAYEITAELPGMDEKNVDIKLSNGTLTIKGEKKVEKEEREKDYYVSERRFGAFTRAFKLPEGVDVEKIEATFGNGVLKVTLPKTAEAQKDQKKIEIKAA